MKTRKIIVLSVFILALLAAALTVPSVVAANSDGEGQSSSTKPAISVSCTRDSGNYNGPTALTVLLRKLESGDLAGHVSGSVEEGTLAGLSWASSEHPGGGPSFWRLSFSRDTLGRGEVAEFWVYVKVLSEPLDPPDGFALPSECALKVRLIDGAGSAESPDFEQVLLQGTIPLFDPEPGYEERLLPAGGVQIDR